jgi:hypothetical protein
MTCPPRVDDVGWFAARQPGIIRFLESRLGTGTDACGVALDAAWRICAAFEARDGVPPGRLTEPLLERAETEAYAETPEFASFGWASRQPTLCAWIASHLLDPPLPLAGRELRSVGLSLAAIVYALDELTSGREIV